VLVHGLCFLHTTTSFASTASTATTITVATAAASSPTCAAASRLYRRHRRHRPIRRRFLCRLQGMVHGPCEDHLCLSVVPLQGLWHLHTSSSSSASFPASTTCSQAAATVAAISATTDHVQSDFVLGVGAHCAVRSRLPRRVRARHPVDGHVASGDDRVDVVRGPCRCDAALATVRAARPAHLFTVSRSFCLCAGRAAERRAYAPPARQGAVAAARQHSHAWWEDDSARQLKGAEPHVDTFESTGAAERHHERRFERRLERRFERCLELHIKPLHPRAWGARLERPCMLHGCAGRLDVLLRRGTAAARVRLSSPVRKTDPPIPVTRRARHRLLRRMQRAHGVGRQRVVPEEGGNQRS